MSESDAFHDAIAAHDRLTDWEASIDRQAAQLRRGAGPTTPASSFPGPSRASRTPCCAERGRSLGVAQLCGGGAPRVVILRR